MHPLLTGRIRLLLYLGVWAGVGVLLAALVARLEARPFANAFALMGPLAFVFGFISLSAWWVCRACPLGATPKWRLTAYVLGAALQAGAIWMGLGLLWADIIGPRMEGAAGHANAPNHGFLFVTGVVLYLQSVGFYYFQQALDTVRAAERRLLESQVTAREAELRALRAQLHPHFLFNSLNSISALTGPEPEAARRMCGLLGDFLRMSLALGARERVALSEEVALASRYLDIEGVRFGPRLAVEQRIESQAGECLVPPLLIQPLVENAVKHGVANQVNGGVIRIDARRRSSALEITVENSRDPQAPPSRGQGLGLENVRRRLAALDPDRARLDLDVGEDRFLVKLTLPAVEGNGDPHVR